MEADGAVVSKRVGRFVRYFTPGTFSKPEREAISAVKVSGSRAVLEVLAAQGELPFLQLARASGMSNGRMAWHLHALVQSGVVETRAEKRYALTDRAAVSMALALHATSAASTMEDAAREIFDGPR
jgi:predicted transcriptional regulator